MKNEPYKIPLKRCPFCGGKAKVSFMNHSFKGQNDFGDKKLKYRVQVICNRCRSRGKPIITDWLTPRMIAQTEAFKPYVEQAIKAWNRRVPVVDKCEVHG